MSVEQGLKFNLPLFVDMTVEPPEVTINWECVSADKMSRPQLLALGAAAGKLYGNSVASERVSNELEGLETVGPLTTELILEGVRRIQ